MRPTIGLLVLAGLAAGRLVRADEMPPFKQGLWQFDRSVDRSDKPGKPETLSTKSCTNPTDDMHAQREQLAKSGCTATALVKKGDTYTFTWECTLPNGATGSGKTAVTVTSDSGYTAKLESDARQQDRHLSTSERLTAKRLGDCPQ